MKQAEIDKFIDYVKRFCLTKSSEKKGNKEDQVWYRVIEQGRPKPKRFTVEVSFKVDEK